MEINMNIPGLIFSVLAIISGLLWLVFLGVPALFAEDNFTFAQLCNVGYNIALSLIAGILGIKYSLRKTKKYGAKFFIIASGVIIIILGRLICGLLLVIAGGLLLFKRFYKKTAKVTTQDTEDRDSPNCVHLSRRFTMFKILKVTGIIAGVLVLAMGGMFLKMNAEMSGFAPLETGKVVDDVSVVKDGFANFFIIQDGTQYIVIDCGADRRIAAEQLKILGVNPDDVSAVFLTHTDSDHTGALGLFDKAKLFLSKEEEQMINGKKSKYLLLIKTNLALPRNNYILLEDRQSVQIGNLKIEGFLAPGHTVGTMAYLVNDRYLFIGDILSLKKGKVAPIPSFFDLDHVQAAKSIDIIRRIPTAEYIFTAHWGYTDDYKKAVEYQ